ncbi:hypothetical protein BN2497_2905 [Janthinobacterium sp. CG23_2]|nr:hypothetical protein BN2497_2905 [Janthinobacterium sp. CG23_2]CUU27850.1 hypothetical protein BN3177_2905 [Janthinobacterium sp. CG23_2]
MGSRGAEQLHPALPCVAGVPGARAMLSAALFPVGWRRM